MRVTITQETGTYATALSLLEDGLWPVPIHAPGEPVGSPPRPALGKEPIGKSWGKERPTVEFVAKMWANRPWTGVGLLLGPRGGVIDLECDGPEGEESIRRLFNSRIIMTCGWNSARGKHRLFQYVPELEVLCRSIVKSDEFPDLELRIGLGDKQIQSVVPPTQGRTWNGFSAIAPFPKEAILHLKEDRKSNGTMIVVDNIPQAVDRARKYLEACQPAISGQGGHNTTFRVVCHAGPGFGLDPDVCYQLVMTHYNPRCEPPWSETEMQHKVHDAYTVETRRGWLYER
jgi:hypothetical protein